MKKYSCKTKTRGETYNRPNLNYVSLYNNNTYYSQGGVPDTEDTFFNKFFENNLEGEKIAGNEHSENIGGNGHPENFGGNEHSEITGRIKQRENNPEEIEENPRLDNLGISLIENNDESLHLIMENLEQIQGANDEKKAIRKQLLHLKIKRFEDYYNNYNYLVIKSKQKYQYYFIFQDDEENFHIQISYYSPKYISPLKLHGYELLDPIRDYFSLKDLLENERLLDIKIDGKKPGLSLKSGPFGGKEYSKLNELLKDYCSSKNIELFVNSGDN